MATEVWVAIRMYLSLSAFSSALWSAHNIGSLLRGFICLRTFPPVFMIHYIENFVFALTNYSSDMVGGRALDTEISQALPGGYKNSSVANCISGCSSLKYTYAGLEYYGECCMALLRL